MYHNIKIIEGVKGGIIMPILYLLIGLGLVLMDIFLKIKTLKENILKRTLLILIGTISLYFLNKSYLNVSIKTIFYGLIIGIIFMLLHILIANGIKLNKKEINKGLVYTSLLIYLLELPSEEFVYRGVIFISLIKLFNPIVAILLTSLIFLAIHIKTWDEKFVWIGSLILALVCAMSVYFTKSIWTAIIIHNLNDFGFLTLVNSRNIFKDKTVETADR